MPKRRYLVLGAWVALAIPVIALTASIIRMIVTYDGKCGGFLPWLAGPKPCTLGEYVAGNLSLMAIVVWAEYWPVVISVIALPVVIGYILDHR